MEKDTTKALSKVIRIDTRAGHYKRKLHTKAGEVAVKVPKLRKQTFETAIIERYRRRDISIEEALLCCKFNLLHAIEFSVAFSLPEIVSVLHGQPALRRPPKRLGKPQCHFGADTTLTRDDSIERGRRNSQLFRQCSSAELKRFQIDRANEFTRVWGIVHGH